MEQLMTLHEVANYLQIGIDGLYKMVQKGKVPAFKVGALWRCRKSDIDEWLEKSKRK